LLRTAVIIILSAVFCLVSKAQEKAPAAANPSPPNQSTGTTPAASQSSSQGSPAAATSVETPEAMAHKYIDVWNSGNKAAIDAFADFIMHNHGGRAHVGPAMLQRVISAWRKSMPDLTFTIDDTVVQGDKVVMRVTLRGTYKERLFPESGDPQSPPRLIHATGLLMFKTGEGKIQEIWQELDEGIMRVEMGAQWKTRAELSGDTTNSQPKQNNEPSASAPAPKR